MDNYIELVSSATEHINNAIEAKDEAVQKLEDAKKEFKKAKKSGDVALISSAEEKAKREEKN